MARLFVLLSVISYSIYRTDQAYFLEEDYIEQINAQATTWKAGVNFDPKMSRETFVKMFGSKGVQSAKQAPINRFKTNDENYESNRISHIPKHFDAREKWKMCQTIGKIRDQGHCASGWSFGASSAFADRLCIATNGDFNEMLSPEELTFCCRSCGFGCQGGYPIKAWEYFQRHGLVTGGEYLSGEGCQPYKVPPCPYDEFGNRTCSGQPLEKNHQCTRSCYGNQDIAYDSDHKFTRDAYYLTFSTIQRDIMLYGPIEASFEVYDDFPNYKSGVYVRTKNATSLGGHAAKLIGWGEEFGVPYWLLVNSMTEQWGDHGTFKFRRGTNECGIDNSTTGGVPVKY